MYRDFHFISSLEEKVFPNWDSLIFVKEFRDGETHVFYLYCLNLKKEIEIAKMKKYPDKLTQLIDVGMQTVYTQGGVTTTNVRYMLKD